MMISNMDLSSVNTFTTKKCSHILPTWNIMTTFAIKGNNYMLSHVQQWVFFI